jgi:hypothetical protein
MRASVSDRPFADPWTWVFLVSALGNLANGVWMLADPAGWYATLPAAVPDFGPLNEHFVRDIGATFTMLGLGCAWATLRASVRLPVLVLLTLFYGLHALVHVYDTSRGLVGPEHWSIDFPAVYLPSVYRVVLTLARARRAEAHA